MLSASSLSSFDPRPTGRSKAAGAVLAVGVLATVAAISHHPSVHADVTDVVAEIVRLTPIGKVVHAVVIVTTTGFLFAMTIFSQRRGLYDERVAAALIAYCTACGTEIAAAVLDGFTIAAIARGATNPAATAVAMQLLAVCGQLVQILTKIGFVATAFAIAMWSITLFKTQGLLRAAGGVGIVAAVATALLTFSSAQLNPHNLLLIVLLQSVWYGMIAAVMLRGTVEPITRP